MLSAPLREQLSLLPGLLWAHLELSLWALLAGASLAIPTGIWVASRPRLQRLALAAVSLLQTIPSLALLAIMVPSLAWLAPWAARGGLHLRSIGYLPALLALIAYSLLPMLRGTVAGLAAVDPALRQAARAVGMTPRQSLLRVALPQALPSIAGGVRTALVWVVGMAVLSTPVGAPSLGNYIFAGLQTNNHAAIAVGCAASAGLALLLDGLLQAIEAGLRPGGWRRSARLGLGALALLYLALLSSSLAGLRPRQQPFRIGAKNFTEQYILAQLVARQVERQTGRPVEVVGAMGGTMAYEALRSGEIDAYVDYTGSLWKTQLRAPMPRTPAATLAGLRQHFAAENKVHVQATLGFANNYALALRRDVATAAHLNSLSDLTAQAPQRRIAGDYEIFSRDEWAQVQRGYALRFAEQRSMDPALMVPALLQGEVDLITAYTSDGRIAQLDLVLLADPQHLFPSYEALLLTGGRVAQDAAVRTALQGLAGKVSLACMQKLNFLVDHDGRSPTEAAAAFFAGACNPT